jgi:hypothetical protein
MARWNDTTVYTPVGATELEPDDLMGPVSDESAAVGSKQRTMTVETARAALAGLATINEHSASHTLNEDDDLAAFVRLTGAATVTLPNSFPTGWQCTVANATSAAAVELSAAGTLVIPTGFSEFVQNNRAVLVIHVGSNVWEAHGALEETGS